MLQSFRRKIRLTYQASVRDKYQNNPFIIIFVLVIIFHCRRARSSRFWFLAQPCNFIFTSINSVHLHTKPNFIYSCCCNSAASRASANEWHQATVSPQLLRPHSLAFPLVPKSFSRVCSFGHLKYCTSTTKYCIRICLVGDRSVGLRTRTGKWATMIWIALGSPRGPGEWFLFQLNFPLPLFLSVQHTLTQTHTLLALCSFTLCR